MVKVGIIKSAYCRSCFDMVVQVLPDNGWTRVREHDNKTDPTGKNDRTQKQFTQYMKMRTYRNQLFALIKSISFPISGSQWGKTSLL